MIRLPLDYAVRNLGRSQLRLWLAVGSAALVALLAIAGSGFVRGMDRALGTSGLERNVMLLGAGSEESIERSEISPQVATLATANIDGVLALPPGNDGVSFVSPEVHVALPIGEHERLVTSAVFRGITSGAFLVHPQVRIVDGRAPEPGTNEVMLGREALASLRRAGLTVAVGGILPLDAESLPIVGIFAAPGTVMDGEIWMPLASLKTKTQRTTDSCVILALTPDGDQADVEAFAATRIELELVAMRESDYYAALTRFLAPVRWLVVATAAIVGFGGLLGGLGTMDAAFASRVRELGTLQALGFRRRAIALSFLQESLLVAAAGGLFAACVALLALDGVAVRSSMGTFAVVVDAVSIGAGLAAAFVLGVVGALVPAIRCLRLAVPDALKSSG
ncbi:MAG: ABC transporter permease [Phycisphaerae bacterium]|nr:ABC transporter permease [Phycisphaerae bacterium]